MPLIDLSAPKRAPLVFTVAPDNAAAIRAGNSDRGRAPYQGVRRCVMINLMTRNLAASRWLRPETAHA